MIVLNNKLDTDSIRSHIIHLHQLARIDDFFVEVEREFLYKLGRKNGVDEATVDMYLQEAEGVSFIIPDCSKKRVVLLYEYISMMLVDNKLDEREAKMCMLIAQKMGFDMALVNDITKAIVTAEEEHIAPKITEEQLEKYVHDSD